MAQVRISAIFVSFVLPGMNTFGIDNGPWSCSKLWEGWRVDRLKNHFFDPFLETGISRELQVPEKCHGSIMRRNVQPTDSEFEGLQAGREGVSFGGKRLWFILGVWVWMVHCCICAVEADADQDHNAGMGIVQFFMGKSTPMSFLGNNLDKIMCIQHYESPFVTVGNCRSER